MHWKFYPDCENWNVMGQVQNVWHQDNENSFADMDEDEISGQKSQYWDVKKALKVWCWYNCLCSV